jgi:hypothetical protein
MFVSTPFYHSLLRHYTAYFGTLFNNISIQRFEADGSVLQTIKVPCSYASKDKQILRVDADPNIDRPAAVVYPRISFEFIGMQYDGDRKLNTMNKVVRVDTSNDNRFKYQYQAVPYNLTYRMYIVAKYIEDGAKILEQIVPYFKPEFTQTLELIPDLDIAMDIPLELNSVSFEDQNEGALTERRTIIWTLDFTMKGYFYGPVRTGGIIKFATVNFYIPEHYADGELPDAVGHVDPAEALTVQPGLDANGDPTTNIAVTIPYSNVNVDDDYAYIVRILNDPAANT